jgi:class 3 adenylate cyclase
LAGSDAQPQLEIAHVLYMDIVGYTRLPLAEQPQRMAELQSLVRSLAEFRRAESAGELISCPTGDGFALVFFRDPVAPIQCAIELSRLLRDRDDLRLRMGLHTGPVYRVADINTNANVAGGGINTARRVMDCGDAGHILLSSAVRELLGQVGAWPVHDLGEVDVKHGQRLHLFSLYTDEFGNPAPPDCVRARLASTPATAAPAATLRIVLLYKRNAHPDEDLLRLLETRLTAEGFHVFVDRHLKPGVEWAKEIERQVRSADAVIPLLSAASVTSEMLQYEVQIAHEAAQAQRGRPRLVPVRVGYTEPLEDPLNAYLGPIEYALWESPSDNEPLLTALLGALQHPSEPTMTTARVRLEPVGGAVALDSPLWVVRPSEEDLRAAIARGDSIILLKGARQMGKTSLLARGLQQAREAGARVFQTDFQMLNAAHLESPEILFRALADAIADQLDLDVYPDDVWDSRRGANVNLQRYLRREVLGSIPGHVVWAMDEVDRLFVCDFASEVFGLFRSWHNARSLDPTGPWSRLTLAIAYATEHHLFISDVNQSPFNVGTRIPLEDFTVEQVADLNARHGGPLRDDSEVSRFCRLVGGQPFLVRRGLLEMASHGIDIATLEATAARDEGIFGDHLRRMLVLLVRDSDLCDVVRGVLRGRPCPTPESFYRLRSAGVMAGDSAQNVWPRCQLYATYLEHHLS